MLMPTLSFASFSSIWYWILMALFWIVIIQYPLGINASKLKLARKNKAAHKELMAQAENGAKRFLSAPKAAMMLNLALLSASLSFISILALYYRSAFALGLFFFAFPGVFALGLNWHAARKILSGKPAFQSLFHLRAELIVLAITSFFLATMTGIFSLYLVRLGTV